MRICTGHPLCSSAVATTGHAGGSDGKTTRCCIPIASSFCSQAEQRPGVVLEELIVMDLRNRLCHPVTVDEQRRQRPVAAGEKAIGPLRIAERLADGDDRLIQRFSTLRSVEIVLAA